jgi:hypothetical protein
VSQEQLDQVKQHMPETEDDTPTPSVEEPSASSANGAAESSVSSGENGLAATTTTVKKKRVKKKPEPVDENSIRIPGPSYWPFLLAFSIAVVLAGAISNLIVLGIGVLLVVISIIGWGVERRN